MVHQYAKQELKLFVNVLQTNERDLFVKFGILVLNCGTNSSTVSMEKCLYHSKIKLYYALLLIIKNCGRRIGGVHEV